MGSNDFGCSRSGVRAVCYSAKGVSRATASPPAAFRAPGPPSTQPSKTASLALTAVLRPPRGRKRKRKRKERPRYRCLAGARPGPARPAAGAAYLGAAVEGGLAEGAAAQGADGDVVQLLLLAGKAAAAAAAAGAAPA